MDENLKQILEYLRQAVEFGKEEMPQVAHEILTYSLVYYWTVLIVMLGLTLTGVLMGRKAIKVWTEYSSQHPSYSFPEEKMPMQAIRISVGIIGCTVGPIVSVAEILGLIQVYVAPRLYLIEYVKGLLK